MINLPENNEQFLVVTDEIQIKRAVKAKDMCSFIYNFKDYLRHEWKRIENIEKPTAFDKHRDKVIDIVSNEFNNMLADHGIDLDELWS